jgi:hypothetical protein
MTEAQIIQPRDVRSVGTRVSWSAIWAGSLMALGLCVLFTTLGTAVGLSISDRVNATTFRYSTVIWAMIISCVALFTGGAITSLMTVGEDKTEAVLHGILTWGVVVGILFMMGTMGMQTLTPIHTRMSGLEGNRTLVVAGETAPNELNPATDEVAKRYAWYTFGGIWLSMIAAAAGAYAGAGPTFRVVAVTRVQRAALVPTA